LKGALGYAAAGRQSIHALEKDVATTLFQRRSKAPGHPTALDEAGRRFVWRRAEVILALKSEAAAPPLTGARRRLAAS